MDFVGVDVFVSALGCDGDREWLILLDRSPPAMIALLS